MEYGIKDERLKKYYQEKETNEKIGYDKHERGNFSKFSDKSFSSLLPK